LNQTEPLRRELPVIRPTVIFSSAILACAVGIAQAQVPAKKDLSTERKAAPPTRGGYDIKKGTSVSRKKPDAAARGTNKPREGITANATTAQGIAHD
jgi:hypothetical protein